MKRRVSRNTIEETGYVGYTVLLFSLVCPGRKTLSGKSGVELAWDIIYPCHQYKNLHSFDLLLLDFGGENIKENILGSGS